MDKVYQYLSAGVCSFLSLLVPVKSLILIAFVFIGVDFVTGVMASRARAKKAGRQWSFQSLKAWHTVTKTVFTATGICMVYQLDTVFEPLASLHLVNIFTGFLCGVELWSYLENAAEISDHRAFKWVRKHLEKELNEKTTLGDMYTDLEKDIHENTGKKDLPR